MTRRVLVAGIGNIFLRDDGFGVAVARRLAQRRMPVDVRVVDFGIRGVHLAYEMFGSDEATILVDAAPRGETPGTVTVLERAPTDVPDTHASGPAANAHAMTPEAVFTMLETLGGQADQVLIVACEPADVSEGMELTEPVRQAVDAAVDVVGELIDRIRG